MKKWMILSFLMTLSTACTTISFVTDENNDRTTYSEWHHDWIYLIEGSDPVDMSARCRGAGWKTIRTELTFVQGIVAGLTSGIYTPHGVEYSCVKPASTNTAFPASSVTPNNNKVRRRR